MHVLQFLIDPAVKTGISKKKISKQVSKVPVKWSCLTDMLDYISIHNSGTDMVVGMVQYFISQYQDGEIQEFIRALATKSYKLGADCKVVNAAVPGLVKTWDVQLGSSYNSLRLNPGEWFSLSQKLNGNRGSYYRGNIISRQNSVFSGLQHIIQDIEIAIGKDWFVDGELIRKNPEGLSDGENFRIGTGILNSKSEDKSDIKFVIFDCLPVDEFDIGKSRNTYKSRREMLLRISNIIRDKGLQNIEVVTMLYEGTDKSQIERWLEYAVENDWEGIMVNKDAPYECKRTKNLIKVKRFYTMDLEVVDIIEGEGKFAGTAGALVVKYKDGLVSVGSGFSDSMRDSIWRSRDSVVGSIVEVKYKEISREKKTGKESLQFPVFVRFRDDKSNVSYE